MLTLTFDTRLLTASHSASGRQPRGDAVGDGVAARPRASLVDLTRERAAHHRLDVSGHGDQAVEVDSGLDPHGVKAVDEILGADIAGGAGGEGAAAQAADRAVEM